MTENKRFKLGYVCGDFGLIANDEWIDLHSMSENSEKNVQICINKMNELAEENEKLEKENKELKQELKDYHNAFDCSQCKYQNYDWFDDGDEFEVCDKGNNEAQMDNHSCKEWEEL